MEIARPYYLNKLLKKQGNGRIKIITGIRRCGKSYLLFNLFKQHLLQDGIPADHIIEIPLEDLSHAALRNPLKLYDAIKQRLTDDLRYYVFIDEIQHCADIPHPDPALAGEKLTFVDTLLSLMKNRQLDIYITGSNSKMLSTDILTQFRDRGDEIYIMPLSFSEYWNVWKEEYAGFTFPISFPFSSPDIHAAWSSYCTYGGMPEIFTLDTPVEKSKFLKGLFDQTYITDIIERNDIRNNKATLDILLDFISSSIGSLTNPLKLEKRFDSELKEKISHNTIACYLDYFSESFLIRSAKRYDIKGAKYFDTPLKYYFIDPGLRNARLNFRQIEESHMMENIIYNDLIRRGYNVDVGFVPYNGYETDENNHMKRSRKQLEVDFVVNLGDQKYYIQSALSVVDPEKRLQETNSLNRIRDSFRKIIISKEGFLSRYDEKGNYYISLWEFLLNDESLMV